MTSPIIIHSMGKCGSRSVAVTLLMNHFLVMHAHRLAHPINQVEAYTSSMVDSLWRKRTHMNVLVLTRMPVKRNVSAYFENLGVNTQPTVEDFIATYNHYVPNNWFETELKEFWGLNVFKVPFDTSVGWQSYPRTDYNIVVARLEDLENVWFDIQHEFGFPATMYLHKFGVNNNPAYAEFKKQHLPDEYIDKMHATRYATHFYTEGELQHDHY